MTERETITCEQCGLVSTAGVGHVCKVGRVVTVSGIQKPVTLWMHEDPPEWPYSRGQHLPSPKQLAEYIRGQSPQTVAAILAELER